MQKDHLPTHLLRVEWQLLHMCGDFDTATGPAVTRAIWEIAIQSYRNFLIGRGHLKVLSKPD